MYNTAHTSGENIYLENPFVKSFIAQRNMKHFLVDVVICLDDLVVFFYVHVFATCMYEFI